MSWKTRLKQKRLSIILLVILICSLAFNVYAYYTIYTQSTGLFNIQLSANTELKLQLDSETYMIIHATTDFMVYGDWITTTDTTGDLEFETSGATVVRFIWLGNVSNVLFGRVDIGLNSISNNTDHSLTSAKTYRLTWNWLSVFVVPPPTEYSYQVTSWDLNTTLPFEGLPFTMTINDTFGPYDYTTTRMDYLDSGNTYKFVFPLTYQLNENTTMVYSHLVFWTASGLNIDMSDNTVYVVPVSELTLTAYYYETSTVPLVSLLPITFIIGMVGLGCLFIGPLYGIHKFRQHEYRNALVQTVIITSLGFALTLSWLWH